MKLNSNFKPSDNGQGPSSTPTNQGFVRYEIWIKDYKETTVDNLDSAITIAKQLAYLHGDRSVTIVPKR